MSGIAHSQFSRSRTARRPALRKNQRSDRRLFFESLEERLVMTATVIWGTPPGLEYDEDNTLADFAIQSDDPDATLTVNYTISGTAVAGQDYTQPSGSVTFQFQGDIPITLKEDSVPDGDKSFIITITAGSGYVIGSPNQWVVTIHDDEPKPNPKETLPSCRSCGDGGSSFLTRLMNAARDPNPSVFRGSAASDSTPSAVGPLPNGVTNTFAAPANSSNPVRYSDGTVIESFTDLSTGSAGIPWGVTRSWSNGAGYARTNIVGNGMVLAEQPRLVQANGNDTLAIVVDGHTAYYFDYDDVNDVYVSRGFLQETLQYDSLNSEFVLADTTGAQLRFYDFSGSLPAGQVGQFKSYDDANGNSIAATDYATDGQVEEIQSSSTVGGTTIIDSFLYTYSASGANVGMLDQVELRRKVGAGSWGTVRKVEYAYYGGGDTHGNVGDLKTSTIKDAANNVIDTTYYRYYLAQASNDYFHGLKFVFSPTSFARLTTEVPSALTAADVDVAPYSDKYFEYDSQQRATKEIAQGAGCSSCAGGQGTFEFSYEASANTPDFNNWAMKTVEVLPDDNENIVYTNYVGQVMLQIFHDTVTDQQWATFFRYDDSGRVVLRAEPSAVSGYDETTPYLMDQFANSNPSSPGNLDFLNDTAGLITNYSYYATADSDPDATAMTAGKVPGYLKATNIREGETGDDVPQARQDYFAFAQGGNTIFLPASTTVYTDDAGAEELTSQYSYTFFSGTLMIESQSTTDVANGTTTVVYDTLGRPTWQKNAAGFINYAAYDQGTGALATTITDVNTSLTTNEPSGWTTPTGGGLHLTTTYELDNLGRPTKATDPNAHITYTVYSDTNHEARMYPGWNTTTNAPTGPTVVMREDRALGYVETLSMSATPHLTGGLPDGIESIGSLQSLSRTYFNAAEQAIHTDDYFSLVGLTYSTSISLGTEGTHFHRAEFAYDSRGRQNRAVRADGTIYRTIFDGLGRPVSEWAGDNDTPVSGTWSPSNPADMVKIREYEYDDGGVGDSNLTSVVDALGRTSILAYDFRNRLVSTTLPDPDAAGSLTSPVYTTEYDNLNRVVSETDALDNITTYAYDDVNREITITSPDPDDAGPLTSPVTIQTRDARGLLVSQTDPLGHVTTYEYDGAGRSTKLTEPDPDGAGSLTSPITQYSYDSAGNLRFVTDALSHVTEYVYDRVDRLTQTIEADPDGAGSATSPVTAYAYNPLGLLQSVTDPLNRVTSYEHDALGRRTKLTEADPDGAGALGSPVTTYGYDGASRVTTVAESDSAPPIVSDPPSSPVTPIILDNAGPEFTIIGTNWTTINGQGYSGSARRTTSGANSTAEWIVGVPDGQYQVAATWITNAGHATNAPFNIINGNQYSTPTIVTVNQQVAPDDFTASGVNWENLAVVTITAGSIRIWLKTNANGSVLADAIRIIRVGDVMSNATIDNGDTGTTRLGTWSNLSTGFLADANLATVGGGTKKATWTRTVAPGQYRLSTTWIQNATYATNAPYTIKDGTTTLSTVQVNQQIAPADWVGYQNSNWKVLGVFNITGTSVTVELTNSANGSVFADAIQFYRVGDLVTQPGASTQLLDDGNTGFSTTGTWTNNILSGYAGDTHTASAGGGSSVASWSVTVTPGLYRVAANWAPQVDRATNAPFTVLDGATSRGTTTVDQRFYPLDFTEHGVNWATLGVFSITGTNLVVQLTNNADNYVSADVIRIERVADLPIDNVTSYGYDFLDNLTDVTQTDSDGMGPLGTPVTSYDYDVASQLLSVTDAAGRLTSFDYDGLGRRIRVTQPDPDGAGALPRPYTTFTYDPVGNLKMITDPLSHVTTYAYDDLYRRTSITDPLSGATSFTYDAAGRMLTLKDPVNNTTTWQYDALNRVTQETNQLTKTRTFTYDAVGNLTERVDRLGRKIDYVYDNLYRNTSEKWYDGTTLLRTLNFTFDAAGQLTAASDPAAGYSYGYDQLGRSTSQTQSLTGLTPQLQYQSKFNASGSRTELAATVGSTADFKTKYVYDKLQHLTMLTQEGLTGGDAVAQKRNDFTYDISGLVTKTSRFADLNGQQHIASSYSSYDGMGRLTKLVHSTSTTAPSSGWGTGALAGYQYTYDAAGRIATIDSYLDGLTTYTNDNTDQLTAADHTGQTDESYTYDANGNRTGGGYSLGTNNQLSSDGTYNYTYDDEGNRLTKTKISTGEKEEYTWDYRNRLTKVTFKNSGGTVTRTVDQSYDVFNQWIKRSVDADGPGPGAATNTYFSYDDGQVVLQFDGNAASNLSHRYLWGTAVDQLLADEQVTSLSSAGNVLSPLGDQLGTLYDLADRNESTGVVTVTNHRRYDAFGNLVSESNAAVDEIFGYTGRALDDSTGQQNNLSRWFDSKTGLWTGEDQVGFFAGDPNLRRYVRNRPTTNTDPNGEEPFTIGVLVGLALAFGYGAKRGYDKVVAENNAAQNAYSKGVLTNNRTDMAIVRNQQMEFVKRSGNADVHMIEADLARQMASACATTALGNAAVVGPGTGFIGRYGSAIASSNAGVFTDELIVNGGQGYVNDQGRMARTHAIGSGVGVAGQAVGDGLNKAANALSRIKGCSASTNVLSKADRLKKVFDGISEAPSAKSADEAMAQMNRILEEIEDAHSGVPKQPDPGLTATPRMYPPQADNIVKGADGSITATSRGHVTVYSPNGGVTVKDRVTGATVFHKPGS
jgi:RHS repeat-associated protein